jgi:uncharacterized protein (UPF0262 family)
MSAQRIVHIELDRKTLVSRSPEVEHERAAAIYDLLEDNRFALTNGSDGPYSVFMRIEDTNRLVIDVKDGGETVLDSISLSLMPFRRIIRDYFKICESYFDAIKRLSPSQIETIDMARRGLHNEGSDFLQDRLTGRADMDKDTARRLFTLLCVLHFRG